MLSGGSGFAGFFAFSPPLQGEGWVGMVFPWGFCSVFRAVAKTDSRPCESYRPSWPARYFLLLVQEKVTKENTPSVPRPAQSAGCATGGRGFADSPSMDCGKSGAIPRAAPRG